MDTEKAMGIIKEGVEEIVEEEELKKVLEKESPVAYLGYAPTGRLHLGHLFNLMKVGHFLDAGFKFKFLIADLHAYLDDKKSPFELLDYRSEYTKEVVMGVMDSLGVEKEKLEFVKGSDFQLNNDYTLDVLKMSGEVTFSRTKRAASEVVRFGDNPKLGGFIYPLMQNEDVVKLGADVAYGGIDQRGIYMLGREVLPELGYEKPVCVFAPLLPGLSGDKMSSSVEKSKVDLLDDEDTLKSKIKSVYCEEGVVKDNPLLIYVDKVLFPILKNKGNNFLVERPDKYGGNVEYEKYEDLESDFSSKKLHPMDLKKAFAKNLADILEPVRKRFENKNDLIEKAYPVEK